jgi:hypothetical protein
MSSPMDIEAAVSDLSPGVESSDSLCASRSSLWRLSPHSVSQIVFYFGWVAMIFVETTLWSICGLVLGVVVFFVGGAAWGAWHIKKTEVGGNLHGGILPIADRMMRRNRPLGVFPAAFLVGGPGVALVTKKQGAASPFVWCCIASLFYTSLWCVIQGLRPEVGIPVGAWPSFRFLHNLSGLV